MEALFGDDISLRLPCNLHDPPSVPPLQGNQRSRSSRLRARRRHRPFVRPRILLRKVSKENTFHVI